jgi:hypothetical protein
MNEFRHGTGVPDRDGDLPDRAVAWSLSVRDADAASPGPLGRPTGGPVVVGVRIGGLTARTAPGATTIATSQKYCDSLRSCCRSLTPTTVRQPVDPPTATALTL